MRGITQPGVWCCKKAINLRVGTESHRRAIDCFPITARPVISQSTLTRQFVLKPNCWNISLKQLTHCIPKHKGRSIKVQLNKTQLSSLDFNFHLIWQGEDHFNLRSQQNLWQTPPHLHSISISLRTTVAFRGFYSYFTFTFHFVKDKRAKQNISQADIRAVEG